MNRQDRVIQELAGDFAPYAATSNIMDVIARRRERGLPNPLNAKTLETIGVPAGNISRTLQALRFLNLIDDDGSHTKGFDRLAQAGESGGEYRELLAEIVRSSYHRVFEIVDPSQDHEAAIHDAFRLFQPEAQRSRMVALFLGLCEQASISERRTRERSPEAVARQRLASPPRRRRAAPHPQRTVQHSATANELAGPRQVQSQDTDYRAIFAVFQQLPEQRQWTSERRQRWLSAIEATVDLMVDIVDDVPATQLQFQEEAQ